MLSATLFLALAIVLSLSSALVLKPIPRIVSRVRLSSTSGVDASDPLVAKIASKLQSDPTYNPLADPEAAPLVDKLTPPAFKEFFNAVERLRVAIKVRSMSVGQEVISND